MKKILYSLFVVIIFSSLSCSVYETIVNLSRLQFKLGNVNGFLLNGVSISDKSKLDDFSAFDIIKLSTAVVQGSLPVSFTLNVEAKNPNDGTGGYKKTDATLKSFPWRLNLDGKEILTGNISSPVTVPGTGDATTIPIQISVDLVKLFKDEGYESLINLALNLGGKGGSASRLTIYAKPTVTSPLGDITYPGELKIVNVEYTK
ncbi:MAG TPA: LEA type 2 family protein [Ignavibacteriaceae bacterium]|nr:LEA type 2 family protein [Ignavibacteriaceae bacterium]